MQNDVNLNFPSYVTEHRVSRSSSRHKLAIDTDNCQPLLMIDGDKKVVSKQPFASFPKVNSLQS